MEAQLDYELDITLAVFDTPQQAVDGVSALRRAGVAAQAISQVTIGPGTYAVEDSSVAEEQGGAGRGIAVGTPVGLAVAGLTVALAGLDPSVATAIVVAGGTSGFVLGGYVGAIARTRYDDDVANWVRVPEGKAAYVVMTEVPSAAVRECAKVRRTLRHAGAAAFLDTTSAEATEIIRQALQSAAHHRRARVIPARTGSAREELT